MGWWLGIGAWLALGFRGNVSHSLLSGAGVLVLAIVGIVPRFRHALCNRWSRDASSPPETSLPQAVRRWFPWVGLPFLLLALLNGRNIATFDNYGMQMTAAALVLEGTTDFSRISGHRTEGGVDCSLAVTYPLVCRPDGAFSATPVGMLLFAVPTFAVGRVFGASLREHRVQWRLAKWAAAWTAALGLTVLFALLRAHFSLFAAVAVALLLGTGSGWIATAGQGLWSQGGVLFGFVLALWGWWRREDPQGWFWLGLGWAVMGASRLTGLLLVAPFLVGFLMYRVTFLRAGAVALACAAGVALFNLLSYGHVLGPQYQFAAANTTPIFSLGTLPVGVYGLLLAPGTGLFIYQPWALLVARFRGAGKNVPPHFWAASVCMGLLPLLLFGSFVQWSGQQCWGTRYLTETLPLWGLWVASVLANGPLSLSMRRMLWGLGIAAALVQANGYLGPGPQWWYHPRDPSMNAEARSLDWSDPAFLYPFSRWLAGERP